MVTSTMAKYKMRKGSRGRGRVPVLTRVVREGLIREGDVQAKPREVMSTDHVCLEEDDLR